MNSFEVIAWLGRNAERTADLCMDSRRVQRGDIFFACPGQVADGRDYISQAIANGAAAIVAEAGKPESLEDVSIPWMEVEALSRLLGTIAHHWYREPSHALTVIAVTGTNGKTTCVNWIADALNSEGVACGAIGTLGVRGPHGTITDLALTTPDVLTMHRCLALLRDAGAMVVALEASSIGLDQNRLDCVRIEVAAFTNLTHDHLDYHHEFEAYKASKLSLFTNKTVGAAVLNVDDAVGQVWAQRLKHLDCLTYSVTDAVGAEVQAGEIQTSGYGLMFTLKTPRGSSQLLTRLVGVHNVSNLLLVAGVLRHLGWGMSRTVRALGALTPVRGRMQVIDAIDCGIAGASPMVVVDYSHTPDALERALRALRATAQARGGRLHCVFGCGGQRDQAKRPVMGAVAERYADSVIITTDNPRQEAAEDIAAEIVAGCKRTPVVELSRARAILQAIWQAADKDVVLIAGKGHETTQEFATTTLRFDDSEWSRLALTLLRQVEISTDTRVLPAEALFWALRGERFDAHDYLDVAASKNACAAVVSRRDDALALEQILVHDTEQALTDCATVWRSIFHIPVIGVTGSNGKTTTKEMIASILRQWLGADQVLATQGNLNNHLGVPLTILRLRLHHQVAVIEMGMNHPGEIAALAAIAQPTIGLVNNAQREHQEFMHTVDAVAAENGAVLAALPENGVAVFPGDDHYAGLWRELAGKTPCLVFGFDAQQAIFAEAIQVEERQTTFQLHTPALSASVTLKATGLHNLRNALAAASCAVAAHVPLNAVVQGLESFDPVAGRLRSYQLQDDYQLIDDSYNANPDSVRAAIDVLSGLQGRRVLVLGAMGELGAQSVQAHEEVANYARTQGINILLTLGEATAVCAQAFGEQGFYFTELAPLLAHLEQVMPAHVLVKGSRSARMERVVEHLLAAQNSAAGEDNHVA